jgi:molybdopterin-guanine dinucleotide biosynthesis protein A
MADGCTLLILAGGRSRRMGRDKAALPVGDGTMIDHLVRRLSPVVDETIVAGGSNALRLDGLRRIDDRYPGMGPLAGIHAGLLEAGRPLVWVVGCDLPDVEPQLGRLLRRRAVDCDAAVPRVDGRPEGVCAVYRRSLAARLETLLRAGHRSVKAFLAGVKVCYVTPAELRSVDPELRSFRNINTPADYEAWLTTR